MTSILNIENSKFVENKILEFSYLFSILNKKFLLNESDIKNKLTLLSILDKLVNVLILVCDNKINDGIKNCIINENSTFLSKHLTFLIKKYSYKKRTNKTKNRGQTFYSTRKLWRQKGTGRARAGSKNSPVFRGGGIVFGPSGISSKIKINKKLKKKLFFTSLVLKIKSLLILDLLHDGEIKTLSSDKKVLILVDTSDYKNSKDICLKYSNYKNITVKSIELVNSFDILKSNFILISAASLFKLFRRLI